MTRSTNHANVTITTFSVLVTTTVTTTTTDIIFTPDFLNFTFLLGSFPVRRITSNISTLLSTSKSVTTNNTNNRSTTM